MEVTVFIEEEKEELIANPDEWKAKVEELGLSGQSELYADDKRPNPFLRMDAGLVRVFQTLCPAREEISKFNKEAIPLKALSAYGLAVHEDYFGKVEIWYSSGHPDPVMVGTVGQESFLMAQWGPEKVTLEECRARAMERWTAKIKVQLQAHLLEWQAKVENLGDLAEAHFNGEWIHIPV